MLHRVLPKATGIYARSLGLGIIAQALCIFGFGQCTTPVDIWNKLAAVGANNDAAIKLKNARSLLTQFEKCKFARDSVYARLMDRICLFEYLVNQNLPAAIKCGLNSVGAKSSNTNGNSIFVTAKAYYNLAYYFDESSFYSTALLFYDTAISFARNRSDASQIVLESRYNKCLIHVRKGDYQKGIEESMIGILESKKSNNDLFLARFYNQNALANYHQSQLTEADKSAASALDIAVKIELPSEVATALKTKALINSAWKKYSDAESLFKKAIAERIKTGENDAVAGDYTDYGNFLIDTMQNFKAGKNCYYQAQNYATLSADNELLAKACTNLGQVNYRQKNYTGARNFYAQAMRHLKLGNGDLLSTPASRELNLIPGKDQLLVLLGNKTELLLKLFAVEGDTKMLEAALKLALIMDSVITFSRHEQLGEQSKLYWRNKTREFYTNALEACYLAGNQEYAFFFMEKSRAVLLNDQLNELGAASRLPASEAAMEQGLKVIIIQHQQLLARRVNPSPEHSAEQLKLLTAQENFEQYKRSLEQKYPAYYQYKYADEVPSLQKLQKYLSVNKQSFVHYFVNDTVLYMMSITPGGSKLYKRTSKNFNTDTLTAFLKLCSNRELLNAHYKTYVSLSAAIYNKLFAPLHLAKGRVIICPDSYLLPFEALATNNEGSHYLVEDYAFSYIYSARYLLAPAFKNKSDGDYLGIAPISFAAVLHVPDLKGSGAAIENAAKNFNNFKLIRGENASKHEFLRNVGKYDVVNIFSHARADSAIKEPAIFMGDSVIYLSELQLIRDIAAKIVVLSACQTSAGKSAAGEGIYSLARGLAAAGIPSVVATIWDADEQSIYQLSAKFDEHIANGVPKDIALQQAKIWFIKQFGSERSLPYYWSNMILIGNTEPVHFSAHSSFNWLLWVGSVVLAGILLFVFFKVRKNSTRSLGKAKDHQPVRRT